MRLLDKYIRTNNKKKYIPEERSRIEKRKRSVLYFE